MEKKSYTYYQEDNMWIGWLEEYSEYWTQGESLDELEDNLRDIYYELNSGNIPNVLKRGELTVG